MSNLSSEELKELRSIIVPDVGSGAFTTIENFSMFLSEFDDIPNIDIAVNKQRPYPEVVRDYIGTVIAEDVMKNFLSALAGRVKGRFLTRVQALIDPVDVKDPMWFRTYCTTDPAYDICVREGFFAFFNGQHPFSAEMRHEVSERKREQIDFSGCFVAVVSEDDVADAAGSQLFDYAFDKWAPTLESATPKKFAVLLFGKKPISWWENWKRARGSILLGGKSVFDTPSFFVRELPNIQEGLADAKVAFDDFLMRKAETPPQRPSGIIVLGDPLADGVVTSVDVELADYLRQREPDCVHFWQSGWALTKRLQSAERDALFRSNPIFVRAVLDRPATISTLTGALAERLPVSLGYADSEIGAAWRNEVAKFRRAYWRAEGEWLDAAGIDEYAYNGPLNEAGPKLALLANFGNLAESVVRVRFEDLPDEDPRRSLLSTKLQELGAGKQQEDDTVAVSLDSLAESVKKFDRARLNIVAAHDQRAIPGDKKDTIKHFEDWDFKIDKLVGEFFPRREPKILRVAVLFQNVDKFDGLRFAEGLTVRRWNLLKMRPAGDGGKLTFDPENEKYLNEKVAEILQRQKVDA